MKHTIPSVLVAAVAALSQVPGAAVATPSVEKPDSLASGPDRPVGGALQSDSLLHPALAPQTDSATGPGAFDSLERQPSANPVTHLDRSGAGSTVTVRGRRRLTGGQERISVQSVARRPALAEPDVMRAVQALPGVAQSSDFSTKVYVRGSSADQNLVLWDGAVVYSPSHLMGLFSTFLSDATGNVDFRKGGFDARYGNRLSSVLRVDPRLGGEGFPDSLRWLESKLDRWIGRDSLDSADIFRLHGSTRLTTVSGSLSLEGRKSGWLWSVAGRRTWIDQALEAARDLDLTTWDLDYVFHDLQGNLTRTDGRDSARTSLYRGRDRLRMGSMSVEWGNLVVPGMVHLRWDEFWWRPSASWSEFDQQARISGIRDQSSRFRSWRLGEEFGWSQPQGPWAFQIGHDHERQRFEYEIDDFTRAEQRGDTGSAWLHAGWIQGSWEASRTFGVRLGTRGSWYSGIDAVQFEPRATLWWRPGPDWQLEAHLGRYAQFLTSLHELGEEEQNDIWYPYSGGMETSTQWTTALSAERSRLPGGFRVRVEGYHKDISRLPQLVAGDPDRNPAPVRPDGNKVTRSVADFEGWAMGGEATISREEGIMTGSVSYSLSNTVLKQTASPVAAGTTPLPAFHPDWDQRHSLKVESQVQWIGNPRNSWFSASRPGRFLRSSLGLQYRSGHPATRPVGYWVVHEPLQGVDGAQSAHDGQLNPEGNAVVQGGGYNQAREGDYFRLDVTPLDFGREGSWRIYWSVLNATDHENPYRTEWTTWGSIPREETTYQFPRLAFFVGWEKEF